MTAATAAPKPALSGAPTAAAENVAATDALGMTAADRREQFELDHEELGIDPASVPYTDKPAGYHIHSPAAPVGRPRPLRPVDNLDDSLPF